MRKLDEIEKRVTAMAGEPQFDPAYMYKSTFYDAIWLINRIRDLEDVLEYYSYVYPERNGREVYTERAKNILKEDDHDLEYRERK